MLPTINLPLNELATFDTELNSAQLLPPLAAEPGVAFADVLQTGAEPTLDMTIVDGQLLPAGGNELPPWPAADAGRSRSGDAAFVEVAAPAGDVPPPAILATPGATPVIGATATTLTLQGTAPVLPAGAGNGQTEAAAQRGQAKPALAESSAAVADAGESTQAASARMSATALEARPPAAAVAEQRLPAALREQQAVSLTTLADQQRPAARSPFTEGVAGALARSLERSATADSGQTNIARDLKLSSGPSLQVTAPVPQAAPTTQLEALLPQDAQPLAQQSVTASAAPAAQPSAAGAAGAATVATQSIDVPVRDVAWAEQIGQRVQLMTSNRLQTAEIRLTPAELGPLRIQVAVDDGAASVTFHAASAVTRDAIEQALPRLREMLAENGLTLSQADIGEQGVPHGDHEKRDDASAVAYASGDGADERDHEAVTVGAHRSSESSGLVDMFA